MRTFIWFIYFIGYLLVHYPAMRKGLKAIEKGDFATADAIADKHVTKWCRTLLKLAGVTVTVQGEENIPAKPCVYVANHRGLYDIPVMLTSFGTPIPLIAKIESEKIPLIRGWMRMFHCLFIDRDDARQGMRILDEAAELVTQGYSVGIFPEGTRYKGEEGGMGKFLSGGFRVAAKTKAPVVPVVLFNTRGRLEGDGHFTMKPGNITVRILPPVETENLSRQELKSLPELVEDMIRTELQKGPQG